jgi:hypothetical protein
VKSFDQARAGDPGSYHVDENRMNRKKIDPNVFESYAGEYESPVGVLT